MQNVAREELKDILKYPAFLAGLGDLRLIETIQKKKKHIVGVRINYLQREKLP